MTKTIFTFYFLAQLIFIPVLASTYYVDNTVSASGNGTSWTSAWKDFSNINWSSVKGGDIIYISGGTSSRTYNETLVVGASGVSGAPITILKGKDAGHLGKVTIDGQGSRSYGVQVESKNYVIVKDLNPINHTAAGVRVRFATAGVLIENMDVYTGTGRGYDFRGNQGTSPAILRNSKVSTPTSTTGQTDGIWTSDNDGVIFEGNTIIISNSDVTGHSDGIQSYLDYSITIRNNWIEQANSAKTDNHGLWLSDTKTGGIIKVYNNVVYVPNLISDAALTHWAEPTWTETGTIRIWNNTIYGSNRVVNLDKSPNAVVKNNIIWPSSGGVAFRILNATIPVININNNLVWAPNASVSNLGSSWSAWQSKGYDSNGVNADPKFKNFAGKDFSLAFNSPAIDKGASISEVTTDLSGIARPQGMAYDIGAYEISISTEIKESAFTSSLDFIYCYPNPFNTNFTVLISSTIILKNAMISIYDICGKEVKNVLIDNHETIIDRGELSNGLYFYNIINDNEKIANGKIVVQDK